MTSTVAMSATEKTNKILSKILSSKKLLDFSDNIDMDVQPYTIFLRLSVINTLKNLPSKKDVESYKIALLNLREFDNFMKNYLKEETAS